MTKMLKRSLLIQQTLGSDRGFVSCHGLITVQRLTWGPCLGAVVVRGLSSKAYQHDHAERPQGQQRALDQCAKHQLNGKHLRCCFVSLFMDSVGFCGVC